MKNEFYRLKNKKVYVDNKYAGKFMGFSYDYSTQREVKL